MVLAGPYRRRLHLPRARTVRAPYQPTRCRCSVGAIARQYSCSQANRRSLKWQHITAAGGNDSGTNPAISLRARYAVSGTDIAYAQATMRSAGPRAGKMEEGRGGI
eukprot:3941315-Rhodomonas_salina.2